MLLLFHWDTYSYSKTKNGGGGREGGREGSDWDRYMLLVLSLPLISQCQVGSCLWHMGIAMSSAWEGKQNLTWVRSIYSAGKYRFKEEKTSPHHTTLVLSVWTCPLTQSKSAWSSRQLASSLTASCCSAKPPSVTANFLAWLSQQLIQRLQLRQPKVKPCSDQSGQPLLCAQCLCWDWQVPWCKAGGCARRNLCSSSERSWVVPGSTEQRTLDVPALAGSEISLSQEGHMLQHFTLALIVGFAWCFCLPSSKIDKWLVLVSEHTRALSRTLTVHFTLLNLVLKF